MRIALLLFLLALAGSQVLANVPTGHSAGTQQLLQTDSEPNSATDSISTASGNWAVVGPKNLIPEISNILWLFGNQSIPCTHLYPQQVTDLAAIRDYAGLVTWTKLNNAYNFTAVKLFAKTKPVISHIFDFCHYLYPSLDDGLRVVSTSAVTYVSDWGVFSSGDRPEMHDGTYDLTTVLTSSLAGFANVTTIARFNTTRIALLYMRGIRSGAGFYAADLYCTRPNSYESGNWHLFPAIGKVSTVKAGQYCRWMTSGLSWRSLDWIYSWMVDFKASNSDIVTMRRIGTSVQGRPINAVFIGKGTRYFIADAAIHGNEKAAPLAIIRFAELIVDWYRTMPSWQHKLNQYTIVLVPVLNPDGYVAGTHENANGRDLNRQFPPEGTTTEPEAWALRWLMANYTPTMYVTFHVGSSIYPLDVLYAGLSVDPYRSYFRSAVQEGNERFRDLQHWGVIYDSVWVGEYDRIGPSGIRSMSAEYAYYRYKATAATAEHWGQAKANLHSQEFYITVALAFLLHHDRPDGFMIHSSAFLVTTYSGAASLEISVDPGYVSSGGVSDTKVLPFKRTDKPTTMLIDGLQRAEGDKWSWDDSTDTITVVGAERSIYIGWEALPPWDINKDGVVDTRDIQRVSRAFGSTPDSEDWIPVADINADGRVDLRDLTTVLAHCWESYV